MATKTRPAGPIHDPQVKAAVLYTAAESVEKSKYQSPAVVLPNVAHHHGLSLDQATSIVTAHGWPRPQSMRKAAETLAAKATDPTAQTTEHVADQTPPPAAAPAAKIEPEPTGDIAFSMVDIDQLHPDPNNVREDLGDLRELAASIRDVGILQPIVARLDDGKLVMVMGHRRHAAARKAGLRQVPTIIRRDLDDPDDVLAAMIVENGQRLDLDPIEEARALARLKRAEHLPDSLLADRISKSQPYVSGRLALLSLTPPQQAAVRAGTLPLARAIKLGRNQGGTTREGARGKKSAAHLTWHHPLAEKASLSCERNGHHKNSAGRPGGVACGSCWEDVIRDDERTRLTATR